MAAALAATVTLAACSGADDDASTLLDQGEPPAGVVEMGSTGDVEASESPAADGDDSRPGGVSTNFDIGEIGREVAIEMRVAMRSDDLRAAVEGISAAASASGGGVASSDVDYGTDTRDGRVTIVVKVPPTALDAYLSGLDDLGEVTGIGQEAVDVSEQLTNLDVRIRNAQQSVDRVRGLLAEATDLREVIDLESELTHRQTELEQLQATQRNLEERVALATVTIQVAPTSAPAEVDDDDTDPGLADGFRTGWDALVAVVFGLGYVLAVGAPLIAVAVVGALVAWRVAAARRRRTDSARPAPPVADDAADDPADDELIGNANRQP